MTIFPTFFVNKDAAAYEIEQSLRFDDGGSTYLNRTPSSAGNQKTWTFSAWLKRGSFTANQGIFNPVYGGDGSNESQIRWKSDNTLQIYDAGGTSFNFVTTQVFRDPSAWYHLVVAVDTTQATEANRFKLYINGEQITAFGTSTYPAQNYTTGWNGTSRHDIGRYAQGGNLYYGGYMAEVHQIDGTQLDPESFGEEDESGVWRPIEYTGGSYGTNGFYMKFDETASNGIGHDHSGQGNNFTASGFNTSGIATDVFSDTPTTNYCTVNPLSQRQYLTTSNGNLQINYNNASNGVSVVGTQGASSGKYYWETTMSTASGADYVGVVTSDWDVMGRAGVAYPGSQNNGWTYYRDGRIYHNGSFSSYGDSYSTGDIIGLALDLDNDKIYFSKNGTYQNSSSPLTATNPAFSNVSGTVFPVWAGYNTSTVHTCNFGQREFAYPPGTASATDYFNAIIWTGDGSNPRTLTGVGFQPDLVWIKARSAGGDLSHQLFDSVRGLSGGNSLQPDRAVAEGNEGTGNGYLSAFTSDGFTVDTTSSDIYVNDSGKTYVAWCWKAGGTASSNTDGDITSSVSADQDAGFSVVTYTGDGVGGRTVGHGLGATLSMCIVKSRGSNSWFIRHEGLDNDRNLNFNTAAQITQGGSGIIADLGSGGSGSQQYFTLQQGSNNVNNVNQDQVDYVAYCWTEKSGVSKFGSFTGNGSSTGPFIECGFKPRMVIVKRFDSTSNWFIYDTVRGTNNKLYAEDPSDENGEDGGSATSNTILSLSTGFQMTSGNGSNASGGTYIFMAWAETFSADADYKALNTANLPAPDVKDGSDYFDTKLFTAGTTTVTGLSFQPDWVWVKNRDQTYFHRTIDSARGVKNDLYPSETSAEATNQSDSLLTFTSDGFTHGKFGSADADDFVAWNWKEGATQGFDIVTYTGNGFGATPAGTQTISHSLGVKPAMILVKNRSRATDWNMYHKALGATKGMEGINDNNNKFDNVAYWNDTEPTSTVFSVGTDTSTNRDGDDFVAYCFAEVEGFSAFPEFVGNGSTDGPFVYLGFRPAFLIIKKHSGESDWIIKDTLRPAYNVNDVDLRANVTNAEATSSARNVDILSNGFKLRTSDGDYNGSGDSFIVIAFAENPFGGDGVSPATAR